MRPYITVVNAGQADQTIERSHFIGYAFPARSVSECEGCFERVRKMHRQATHNVPAYVLGEGCRLQWAGDDGEPRGTSGAPIAHMLVNEGISDVAIMVTRYFGGIKLGTGGLVRAYTGTAKLALAAAGLGKVSERLLLTVKIDYAGYNRLEVVTGSVYHIENTMFSEKVTVILSCEPDKEGEAVKQLLDTAPKAILLSKKTELVTTPLSPEEYL